MTEPKPDAAELRHKIADGIPPSLIDSPAVGVGAARRLKLAVAMLAAVEYAGYVITTPDRLLPADAETRTEWGVRVTPDSGEPYLPGLGMLMTQQIAEGFAVVASRTPGVANAEVLTRKAWDGPWLPAPTEES